MGLLYNGWHVKSGAYVIYVDWELDIGLVSIVAVKGGYVEHCVQVQVQRDCLSLQWLRLIAVETVLVFIYTVVHQKRAT